MGGGGRGLKGGQRVAEGQRREFKRVGLKGGKFIQASA